MRHVALVVGDTPGHFFPALAVATAYKRRRSDVDIVFFGPPNSGSELVERGGWQYCPVPGGQLARVGLAARSRSAIQTLLGVLVARRALRALNTQLILGFGAYSSGAVVLAGKTLGVATAISEGNVRAGIANRLLARLVHRIYVAHADAESLPLHRARVTGWPIRPEIAALLCEKRCREDHRRLRILVCSGSRCGEFFGRSMPDFAADLQTRGFAVNVWHQSADAPIDPVAQVYQRSGIDFRIEPFIGEIAEAYRWADFVVTRGGAGTLAEIAAAALPSLIVPLPDAAEDHQSWNARKFAASGAALWVAEDEWDSIAAAEKVSAMMSDPERWAAVSAIARTLAVPCAADAIVDDCEHLLNERA